jgi:hypothetical protein
MRLIVNGGALTIATGPRLVPVSADRFRPPRADLFFRSGDAFELSFQSDDEFELNSMEGETTWYRRAPPWSPTADDLRAVGGRYHSDDIEQVFEVLPVRNGLTCRFEKSPERALELEPVARDTYMQEMAIVRFLRDADGKVTGFDYSNPAVRNLRFTRL